MSRVLSGIQPSGNLHLGNYLGSIKNWLNMQDLYQCFFGVMDLHAITVKQDPKKLQENIYEAIATYLACGLDEKKVVIFQQSQISAHLELAWILSTITPLGWLNRMTQFKEKAANNENLGLYSYPVLMAADILLYKSDIVPVGEDQKQHLELTRDLAGAFNRRYKTDYFKIPEPAIIQNVKRIMSLQDGSSKMSKSDISDLTRINLSDDDDLIVKKIKKAKTDSNAMITYDPNRLEIYNLLNIFAAISDSDPKEIAIKYQDSGFGKFKTDLADSLIAHLSPIRQKFLQLKNDRNFIYEILKNGNLQAQEIAEITKKEIYEIVGVNG